jgi:outer membrane protein OmpA-like peptidoglycan-associated protein
VPCRSRPLFLIPSLMTRPSVETTLLDLVYELAGPSSTLVITGHTSPDDARALYNQTLSERRAENVVRYLKAYLGPMFNITPQRTLCRGLGQAESELHPGDDPADWRKVDVHLNGRLAVRMIAL